MKRAFPIPLALLVAAVLGCAGANRGAVPDAQGSHWADEVLAGLTLEQKVGQMIYPRSFGAFENEDESDSKELMRLAREGRIGGVVFFQGNPYATAAFANRLQEVAPLPLLMASDYEWGAAMRVDGAARFPRAMAFGAGGTTEDVEFQAEVTAREAKALGVHLLLNPVLDLNVNPRNSVINTRSFGSDPERVSELGVSYIRRAQQAGVLTTAKHFPGHGASEEDSHVRLPVVRLDRQRLADVELAPFRAAVDAGVAAVMTAHIAVPALGGGEDLPATLSREILEGVLRDELGFDGLIVSDALDMGGAREGAWDGEVAVAAVNAGVDMLLVPPDARVTFEALARAVRRNQIDEARIDEAVRRILEAKARLRLNESRRVDLSDLPRRLNPPAVQERIDSIFDRSVTVVRDEHSVLPLRRRGGHEVLLVELVGRGDRDTEMGVLAEEIDKRARKMRQVRVSSDARAADFADVRPGRGEVVVVASFARARYLMGSGELGRAVTDFLERLRADGAPVVVVSLGNPYVLNLVPAPLATVATYDSAPASQRSLARVLFGEVSVSAKLPVSLSEEYPRGRGVTMPAPQMKLAPLDRPEEVGMSQRGLDEAAALIEAAVADEASPGAVVLVARRGRIVLERAFGRLSYEEDASATKLDTIYDLASLTKVIVTTTLSMMLHERGLLDLESPVSAYIPEFSGDDKDAILVEDLLSHSGGLLWWTDLYKQFEGLSPDEARRGYLRTIYDLPLDTPPRSKMVYTDLGLMLLGETLERITGKPLDVLAREEIFEPLEMEQTLFQPDASLLSRIAPTERDEWRGRVVHGEVHDENAFGLGGVAPHAGLFSTARSLAPFVQMLLNGGAYDGRRLLNPATIALFTTRSELVAGSSRALGWDTPSEPSSSGQLFSASSYGHTGFTGTSIWVDPEREVFAILLTNRVHLTRDNRKIYDVRPKFHDAVMRAIVDEEVEPRSSEPRPVP